jgi:hypothetical protein
MDALAVSYAAELSRFDIETTIIVPGSFTKGTNHFANSGHPGEGEGEFGAPAGRRPASLGRVSPPSGRFRACVWLEHVLVELAAGLHSELAERLA